MVGSINSSSHKPLSRRTVCKLTAGAGVLPLVTSSAAAENDTRIDVGAGENGFQFDSDDVVIDTHGHKYVKTSGTLIRLSAESAASRSSSSVSNRRLPSS